MTPSFFTSFRRALTFALASLVCVPAALAAPVKFDIPAQPLPSALQLFIKQSGTQVAFVADELKNVRSHDVTGDLEPAAALKALLLQTGYTATERKEGWFAVVRDKDPVGTVQGSLALPDGSPAMHASVSVYETGESADTDKDGRFVLTAVPAGTHVLVITSPECQTLHITDVHVRADEELTLAKETLRKADDVAKLEPYEVSAQTIEQMEKYIVNDTNAKPPPFSDANVDIPRGMDDVQPYYIFNAQTIQQSGTTNVEDFLKNYLTMDTVAQSNSQKSVNFYGGTSLGTTSTIGLSGLGPSQTLILVDGRRTANVSLQGNTEQPDINGIPLSAIDRIEVLPSSASAIYGGSAVGGVVNIVLKKNYQGGEIQYTYDIPFDADAPLRTLNATYGFALEGGKTQVMISAQYSDGKVLLTGERLNLFNRGYANILKNDPSVFNIGNGGYGAPLGATPNFVSDDGVSELTLKNGGSLNATFASVVPGTSPSETSSLSSYVPGKFNLSPADTEEQSGLLSPMGSVPREKSLMFDVHREITPWLSVFAEFSVSSNIGDSLYDPLNTAGGNDVYVPSSAQGNPFNQNIDISFPNSLVEGEYTDSVTRSVTAGVVAKLPFQWRMEADYTWSQNTFDYMIHILDYDAFSNALNGDSLNLFADTSKYPLNLDPYLGVSTYAGNSSVNDLAVRASGPFISFPWGKPTLTFGLEHRKEGNGVGIDNVSYPISTDESYVSEYFGQSESTNSVYAETEIPIVTAKNAILGLRSLELQAAVRTEDYSVGTGTSGEGLSGDPLAFSHYQGTTVNGLPYHSEAKYTATKPMAGLIYKPIDDLILRASYATAFLPPTYSQLTNNPVVSTYTTKITDPQNGKTYGVNTVQEQNQNLTPQNSKDWDIGVVWEPSAELLKGLRFDLEFFQIKEFNVISSPPGGAQFIVDNASNYANRITRDSTTGLITLVDTSSVNLYELETEGYDLALDYRKATSLGTFDLYALGTVQEHYKQQVSLTEPLVEYVGFPSDGGPSKIKANATLTWNWHHLTLGWSVLFFGSYGQNGAPGDPNITQYESKGYTLEQLYGYGLNQYVLAQGANRIPSQTIHNIFVSYSFGQIGDKHGKFIQNLASNWTVQVGVKNVFNTLPPFDAYYSPYYYSPYGDPRLRDLWVSIKHDF